MLGSLLRIARVNYGCFLCGAPIYDSLIRANPTDLESKWLQECRIIYRDGNDVVVTDMLPLTDQLRPRRDFSDAISLTKILPQSQEPVPCGFALHDHCWILLQNVQVLDARSLDRLLVICRPTRLPLQLTHLDPKHMHNHLTSREMSDCDTWEGAMMFYWRPCSYASMSPYSIPGMPEILTKSTCKEPLQMKITHSFDLFSRLPWEVIENIVGRLPTRDVLNMRLVFRSLQAILKSTGFWRSRFEPRNDRGYIFEAKEITSDWATLYRNTAPQDLPRRLWNRKRVWSLSLVLSEMIQLRLASDPVQFDESKLPSTWTEVMTNIEKTRRHTSDSCRPIGSHTTQVPGCLSSICFAFIVIRDVYYLTGIRLKASGCEDSCLGYFGTSVNVEHELKNLEGFVLAIGPLGVHALKVVHDGLHRSEWIGNPAKSPITERLVSREPILGLRVIFDGFKICGIGISRADIKSETSPIAMKQMALWYPSIPTSLINEESYSGQHPLSAGYSPMSWICFGGNNGMYLKHITGITGHCPSHVYGLQFHYDGFSPAPLALRLGRDEFMESSSKHFQINGAEGEIIESIEVAVRRYPHEALHSFKKHGALTFIKITTNQQRKCSFGIAGVGDIRKKLSISPETVITGLYACQHMEYGLISLGVLSDKISVPAEASQEQEMLNPKEGVR